MDGINEERLVGLARELAAAGLRVLTVAPPDLTRYRLSTNSTDELEDTIAWASSQAELAPDGRVGIVGFSFSGGLALVAAGRPAVRDRVAFVLSFGGHGDLSRVLRYLCQGATDPVDASARDLATGGEYIHIPKPHDYGAVVALGLAAAHPERVDAVIVYEPPLMSVIPAGRLGSHADLPARIVAAHAAGGEAAAARAFLEAIGAAEALENASASTRAALLDGGDGVLADVGAMHEAVVDLARIRCPVTLVTGDASDPFYVPIADAVAAAIPQARRVRLAGLTHDAPITRPGAFAELIHEALSGRLDPGSGTIGQ